MSTVAPTAAATPQAITAGNRWQVLLALASVYLVWGST
jgi:hypothetical protein